MHPTLGGPAGGCPVTSVDWGVYWTKCLGLSHRFAAIRASFETLTKNSTLGARPSPWSPAFSVVPAAVWDACVWACGGRHSHHSS